MRSRRWEELSEDDRKLYYHPNIILNSDHAISGDVKTITYLARRRIPICVGRLALLVAAFAVMAVVTWWLWP